MVQSRSGGGGGQRKGGRNRGNHPHRGQGGGGGQGGGRAHQPAPQRDANGNVNGNHIAYRGNDVNSTRTNTGGSGGHRNHQGGGGGGGRNGGKKFGRRRNRGGGGGGGRPNQVISQQYASRDPRDARDARDARDTQDGNSNPQYNSANGSENAGARMLEGILHFTDDRHDGTLRDPVSPGRPLGGGYVVPRNVIRDLALRPGVMIRGEQRGRSIGRIESIEGRSPEDYAAGVHLYEATALDPAPVLRLEHDPAELTTRTIDILAPIGFGQRGLIVAPPRTGKTILLQNMAKGIAANYPDVELWLLLIDERPEEVTDMKRNVPGTVYASSNDNTIDKHLDLAQIVIERAKRKVEFGGNVVILLDSLTRLGRAFNAGGPGGGRTMSGGLDNRALEIPKRLFGAARKIENGGSLTILATCLIDTGSRMDQVIFEEFKGTGNMELTLDRNISNQRIYPALNIAQSGTRKEEKLLDEKTLAAARSVRRHLINMQPVAGMKSLLEALQKHPTNASLLKSMRL